MNLYGVHSKRAPFVCDQYFLRQIGDKVRLIRMKVVRESGFEDDEFVPSPRDLDGVKEYKHLMRARNKVFEYAYCNEWDYFFTGTLDGTKQDRSCLESFEKRFAQMVRDIRRRTGLDVQYLIVPELHSDLVNWHCHGLLKGVSEDSLTHFRGQRWNWNSYSKNFGYNSLEPIRSHEAVSKYMTKYITKTFNDARGVTDINKHMYLVSRGLKSGEVIKKGSIVGVIDQEPVLKNDFCSVWEFTSEDIPFLLSLYKD